MFKRMLVAYDGSDTAEAALAMAIDVARRLEAEIYSISVEEHLPRYAASISEVAGAKEQIDAHFRHLTKHARDVAALAGVELEAVIRRGNQVDEIVRLARTERFDLLVLGSHGHGHILDRLIGSTTLSVARVTPCSVLIVRTGPAARKGLDQINRILVGLDGSPLGRLAFRTALDLAVLCAATVTGATVQEASPLARADATYVQTLKAAAEEHARSAGVVFEHVTLTGHAAQALRDHAHASGAGLIVVGATGLERPWSVELGGTATAVASEAGCSVLLVRPPQAILHVRDIMVRAVSWVTTDAPLIDVVELLLRRNVKAVPVLDARRHVVGIVTGGDLLSRGDMELRLSIKQELDPDSLGERLRALRTSSKSVRDVMTRHVHTIDADVDLATAIRLMASHNVKRLPVVNRDKELVGIVSRADLLRTIAALPQPEAPHVERQLPGIGRTVADAATIDVPVVPTDAPADEVLERVLESDLRRVVVVDRDQRVVGLVSDRDLLARTSQDTRPWVLRMLRGHRAPSSARHAAAGRVLTAAQLMGPSLFAVRPDDTLTHAIRLMLQHQVKRLVVVDAGGRFRGMVDRRELLRMLAGDG
jgi:nucleotide-binding universal stress UspA family protein